MIINLVKKMPVFFVGVAVGMMIGGFLVGYFMLFWLVAS